MMTGQCRNMQQCDICEIIVHTLVIVQNNKYFIPVSFKRKKAGPEKPSFVQAREMTFTVKQKRQTELISLNRVAKLGNNCTSQSINTLRLYITAYII